MSSSVDSDGCDRAAPDIFGFAVEARHRGALDPWWRGSCVQGAHPCDGLRTVVRHYGDTPESAIDPPPLRSPTRIFFYEGRVDNRADVARALRQPHLAGSSDGAVLAAAYDAWGHALSARVIGEFAFAAVDFARKRIVAGQDSLGIRRIFYRLVADRLWVSSNLRLMFATFPASRPDFDPDVLPEYFAGTMQPWSGRTIWRGVREIHRGGVLTVTDGHATEDIVWRPTPPRGPTSPAEVDASFRQLLFAATDAALRAPSPLLCDVSGGLDSSTICAIAALLARRRRSASRVVGWSTANPSSNDGDTQRAVCEYVGIQSVTLNIDDHLPFQRLGYSELPTSGFVQCEAADSVMRAYCRTHGIRARLTGHGADALLQKGMPPPSYLADWIRAGRVLDWARDVHAHVAAGRFSAWHLLRDCTIGSMDMHAGRFRHCLPPWFTTRFRARVADAQADFEARRHRVLSSTARERVFRSTLSFVPYHGNMLPDERMPFAYRPLVEFLLGLEWSHLTRPGEDRPLVRRALSGILPATVLDRRANSRHSASVIAGLRAAWPKISPLMTGEQLGAMGAIEPKAFQKALTAVRAGYQGENPQCTNTALYLEPWLGSKARPGIIASPSTIQSLSASVR